MSENERKNPLVLVVDDETQMRRLLRVTLEMNGYDVVDAASGQAALSEAIRCQPDLILLDLGLPDVDGITVLKRLREWSEAPVIVVSVRRKELEKIEALDCGANDFITKPLGTGELLARLRAIRRYTTPTAKPEVFRSGDLTVDIVARTVKLKGRTVKLTATEYALLLVFVRHAAKALTHGYLLREVWGVTDPKETAALRVYVGYLREKLEEDPARPRLLLTEPGVGYRLALVE